MVKRSRSRSRGRSRTKRNTSAYRTPQSIKRIKRGKSSSSRGGSYDSMVSALADVASGNYIGAAINGGYAASQFSRSRSKPKGRVGGYNMDVHNAGTAKSKKLGVKKTKVNGKYTEYGIAKLGITLATESRKTVQADEACAIGHTSMPGKITGINLWRALLKRFMLELKVVVKDYGIIMLQLGFVTGDIIRINRYPSGLADTTTSDTYTIDANDTLDEVAANLAAIYDDISIVDDKFDSMELLPQPTSRFPGINLNMVGLSVSVYTKSILKVQNVTVEVSTDNEADDINAVPLKGKLFGCKGNNFQMKSNRSLLSGLYNTFNEEALFGAFSKQNASIIGGTSVGYYGAAAGPANSDQTTFYKPAEIPKDWEIARCKTMGNVNIPPGGIKSSVLTKTFTMSFDYLARLLYGTTNLHNDRITYNDHQGFTNVMYLEKIIGKAYTASNKITLWTELEFRQSVLVHGGQSKWTLPITYQTDYT